MYRIRNSREMKRYTESTVKTLPKVAVKMKRFLTLPNEMAKLSSQNY